jgi:hypothetical protein
VHIYRGLALRFRTVPARRESRSSPMFERLGAILVDRGVISQPDLEAARENEP